MNKYAIGYFDDNNKVIRILFRYDSLMTNRTRYKVLKNAVPIINIKTENFIFKDGKYMDTRYSCPAFLDIDIYEDDGDYIFEAVDDAAAKLIFEVE